MEEKKKRRFIWPAIIVSCLPLALLVHFPANPTSSSIALYAGALAGYVGTIFLLWMYILGTKSVMGVIFKDLAPVISIHKNLGRYGSLAFLLHPVLVAYSYYELKMNVLWYIITPDIGSTFERAVTLGRIAFFLIFIIWVTSVLLRKKIGFRPWKYIHYFAYISLPFVLLHVPNIGSQFAGYNVVKVYYVWIIVAFAFFTLFRISGWLNLDRKHYTILSHTKLTDQDYMFVLQPRSHHWLRPKTGQYVYIKKGIISEDHPFSLTYFDHANGNLTVTYRVFGSYTKYLATLKAGASVSVMGPFGTFTEDVDRSENHPTVYIAGGVGITPFIQRVIDENDRRVQYMFAANRTHASAVLVPTVQEALGERLIAIYSREAPLTPAEEQGHISEAIIQKHITTPLLFDYYICGPQDFVKEARRILRSLGVPKQQVKVEEFSW